MCGTWSTYVNGRGLGRKEMSVIFYKLYYFSAFIKYEIKN